VLVLNTLIVSHLIYLSLTKATMQQCLHPNAKHLLYRFVTPSFLVILFVLMLVTIGTFVPIHSCAFLFLFNLTVNIFPCPYASITLIMKPLTLMSSAVEFAYYNDFGHNDSSSATTFFRQSRHNSYL